MSKNVAVITSFVWNNGIEPKIFPEKNGTALPLSYFYWEQYRMSTG